MEEMQAILQWGISIFGLANLRNCDFKISCLSVRKGKSCGGDSAVFLNAEAEVFDLRIDFKFSSGF